MGDDSASLQSAEAKHSNEEAELGLTEAHPQQPQAHIYHSQRSPTQWQQQQQQQQQQQRQFHHPSAQEVHYQFHPYQQQQQQLYHPSFQTFQQSPVQQGMFDMSNMAHTLPPVDYRQQQYGTGALKYNSLDHPPPASHQSTIPVQFSQGQLHNPPYYIHQQSQVPQGEYYGSPGPLIHPNRPGTAHQPGYAYYTSQAVSPSSSMQPTFQPSMMPPMPPMVPYQYEQPSQHRYPTGSKNRKGSTQIQAQTIRQARDETKSANVVRGPPRKPKQSGHAVWIGNLPPQTGLMDLVHHVCEKTEGLESLFLISKSNCAFANYKDEMLCQEAQRKINDTRFMSVRLVSRLRKNSVEVGLGISLPTGPAALTAGSPQPVQKESQESSNTATPTDAEDETKAVPAQENPAKDGKQTSDVVIVDGTSTSLRKAPASGSETAVVPQVSSPTGRRDRYYILKSLTVEDLESSKQTGIWATQSHNEEVLNHAFKTSKNVYLIFSANKSGEYFGYAKMLSEINKDPAEAIEFAPKAQALDGDLPKAIPTEATEFAPPGRIIDDSARGTIFWEAQREDEPGREGARATGEATGEAGGFGDAEDDAASERSGEAADVDGKVEAQAWGKPFRLQWLSTVAVPFYRTRGLRNPLNNNRDVKIARDGTEVDPAVGQRLVALFHQPVASSRPSTSGPFMPMFSPHAY